MEIDGENYLTIAECEERQLASRSTIYRRRKQRKIVVKKGINGKLYIAEKEFSKNLKPYRVKYLGNKRARNR